MAIKARKMSAIPNGNHTGSIVGAQETTRVFNPDKGAEEIVQITIAPDWRPDDGSEVLPVTVSYSPTLNGLSALSKLLARLDREPKDGEAWEAESLIGTNVAFSARRNDRDFVTVMKDTLRAA